MEQTQSCPFDPWTLQQTRAWQASVQSGVGVFVLALRKKANVVLVSLELQAPSVHGSAQYPWLVPNVGAAVHVAGHTIRGAWSFSLTSRTKVFSSELFSCGDLTRMARFRQTTTIRITLNIPCARIILISALGPNPAAVHTSALFRPLHRAVHYLYALSPHLADPLMSGGDLSHRILRVMQAIQSGRPQTEFRELVDYVVKHHYDLLDLDQADLVKTLIELIAHERREHCIVIRWEGDVYVLQDLVAACDDAAFVLLRLNDESAYIKTLTAFTSFEVPEELVTADDVRYRLVACTIQAWRHEYSMIRKGMIKDWLHIADHNNVQLKAYGRLTCHRNFLPRYLLYLRQTVPIVHNRLFKPARLLSSLVMAGERSCKNYRAVPHEHQKHSLFAGAMRRSSVLDPMVASSGLYCGEDRLTDGAVVPVTLPSLSDDEVSMPGPDAASAHYQELTVTHVLASVIPAWRRTEEDEGTLQKIAEWFTDRSVLPEQLWFVFASMAYKHMGPVALLWADVFMRLYESDARVPPVTKYAQDDLQVPDLPGLFGLTRRSSWLPLRIVICNILSGAFVGMSPEALVATPAVAPPPPPPPSGKLPLTRPRFYPLHILSPSCEMELNSQHRRINWWERHRKLASTAGIRQPPTETQAPPPAAPTPPPAVTCPDPLDSLSPESSQCEVWVHLEHDPLHSYCVDIPRQLSAKAFRQRIIELFEEQERYVLPVNTSDGDVGAMCCTLWRRHGMTWRQLNLHKAITSELELCSSDSRKEILITLTREVPHITATLLDLYWVDPVTFHPTLMGYVSSLSALTMGRLWYDCVKPRLYRSNVPRSAIPSGYNWCCATVEGHMLADGIVVKCLRLSQGGLVFSPTVARPINRPPTTTPLVRQPTHAKSAKEMDESFNYYIMRRQYFKLPCEFDEETEDEEESENDIEATLPSQRIQKKQIEGLWQESMFSNSGLDQATLSTLIKRNKSKTAMLLDQLAENHLDQLTQLLLTYGDCLATTLKYTKSSSTRKSVTVAEFITTKLRHHLINSALQADFERCSRIHKALEVIELPEHNHGVFNIS